MNDLFSDSLRQLRKLSIYKPMQFQVTQIEFDFDDEQGTLSAGLQEDLICDVRTTVWEACDEDDLIEEITCATGWCVKSVDYVHVLN